MKTVLIAWELGSGLGHIMRAAACAREFAMRGYRPVVCLAELAASALASWPENVLLLQSPRHAHVNVTGNLASYGDILYACGYHDGNQLAALVTSWSHLMELADPDLVLVDHAPTAQLAARINDIKHARIGTGFFAPPPSLVLPAFRTWDKNPIDASRVAHTEKTVLAIVNAIQRTSGMASSESIGIALRPDLELIVGWPELDPYGGLRNGQNVTYIGNERVTGSAKPVPWHSDDKKKIGAYLKGHYPQLRSVLRALAESGSSQAYISGTIPEPLKSAAGKLLHIATAPLDLRQLAEECDVFVCHAGAGAAPVFIEAGKPVLLLPYQAEQRVNADLIAATGAGLRVDQEAAETAFGHALGRLLVQPQFTVAARQLAARWSSRNNAITFAVEQAISLL